jgi:hypothetical protein
VKLGAELSAEVTEEVTETSGCDGGRTEGVDWTGCGSGTTGDSLGGFATGSGAGSAAGSLEREVLARYVVTRQKYHSRFGIDNLIATDTEATKLHADLLEAGAKVIR